MTTEAPPALVLEDRYEVRSVLGKRGRCVTYLALDRHTRAAVAIKEIPSAGDYTASTRAHLEAAFERLRELDHPRIPRFLRVASYEREGPRVALVQAFVKGITIAQHVAEGRRFEPQEAINIARGVADALAYLHARKVLHGSICPSHILLDGYGSPHLIDFGVIELVLEASGVPTGEAGGPPPGYTPFEQFAGKAVPASDVYALGMSLVFAVTGRDPLQDAAAWDRAKIDPVWPEPFRVLLAGMTAPAWQNRWRNGAALQKALPQEEQPRAAGTRGALAFIFGAIGFYFWLIYSTLGGRMIPFVAGEPPPAPVIAQPPSKPVTQPLYHGEGTEAAKRFLGAEHESGQISWDWVQGRMLLFVRGQSPGYYPAYRGSDGTLVLVEGDNVLVGRPENWRRRVPAPGCMTRRVALDEYENIWADTECGRWRYDVAWNKAGDDGPFPLPATQDASGATWTPLPQGKLEIVDASGRRVARTARTPALFGLDNEGRAWSVDAFGRATIYDRQKLLAEADR
ncbi:MAG: serine/threonine protein kinase [Elusimicrobia bacterium]|nr:serine/threonine protein kinase [Elusimicrobiota bacterium]